ncbi:MAG: septal ring lytic transglycosylase RlpA family protein, partial [Xanthomonadaceae bacterium]|nr:septal ring lytic transglycosylase RlpA family protein [Xanthomonadaceae bacterium]
KPTAAHKLLPLPTHVRVTNLENGRSMIVRVNDRGPFVKGRIIDLSAGASKKLGFYAKGTARVRVETVQLD